MSKKIFQNIESLIESEINSLVEKISDHFSISVSDILDVINSVEKPKKKLSPKTPKTVKKVKEEDISEEEEEAPKPKITPKTPKKSPEKRESLSDYLPDDTLSLAKYNKDQLKAICKSKSLRVTGTCDELRSRIMEINKAGSNLEPKTPASSSKKTLEPKTPAKKTVAPKQEPSILKKINQTLPSILVKRNKFGNYEHLESHLILDKEDKVVIGKQLDDGTIADITDEDIEICKKYKFEHRLPENLDKNKKNIDDVAIEDMDEELGEDDFEEDVEEELSDEEVIDE